MLLHQLKSRVRSCVSAARALTSLMLLRPCRLRLCSCVIAARALTSLMLLHQLRSRLCSCVIAERALTSLMLLHQLRSRRCSCVIAERALTSVMLLHPPKPRVRSCVNAARALTSVNLHFRPDSTQLRSNNRRLQCGAAPAHLLCPWRVIKGMAGDAGLLLSVRARFCCALQVGKGASTRRVDFNRVNSSRVLVEQSCRGIEDL
jgi:hypothetical protein